jgi:glycosyltransferase involved in cell wall biosynthesis
VGPGTRFLSGITYYTYGLANALAPDGDVSVIFLRRLLPARLYPGRERVGAPLTQVGLAPEVDAYDGVDWYWLPSLAGAVRLLARRRPRVLLLQWWTGTVLHTYLALALVARLLGARVVVEFHEVLDTGEDRMRWVRRYVDAFAPWLFRGAVGYVVHSDFDRRLVVERFGLDESRIEIVPHATIDHFAPQETARPPATGPCELLYFGVIRPFKGVDDLVRAFDAIPAEERDRYRLTVVGETWEDCTEPGELIEASPNRERIRFVNRYVTDEEVSAFFDEADVVVLPYHRSSQSGPLHIALNRGLPVVVTRVGGLVEAVEGYDGAVLVPPRDPVALLAGIRAAAQLRGRRFADPRGWSAIAQRYRRAFARLLPERPGVSAPAAEPSAARSDP